MGKFPFIFALFFTLLYLMAAEALPDTLTTNSYNVQLEGSSEIAETSNLTKGHGRTLLLPFILKTKLKLLGLAKGFLLSELLKTIKEGHFMIEVPSITIRPATPTVTTTREPDRTPSITTTTMRPNNSTAITCQIENDLVLLVDESSSVTYDHFQTALHFAANLAEKWIANDGNRVAVFFFSHQVRKWISLRESTLLGSEQIKNKILQAAYLGGSTAIHAAIDEARFELLANNRSMGVPLNVVVMSDGISTIGSTTDTETAARRLFSISSWVRGFAIGVGNQISEQELLYVAQKREHLFKISGFDQLLELLRPVSTTICKP